MKNIDLEKEQKLLARAQQNKTRFSDLYQYYLNDVYRFSYSICGNQHDAEDITSQTFVEMFNYLEKFEWKGISLKFWLFRTAKNLAYRSFDKASKSQTVENFDIIPEAKEESFEKIVLDKDELKLVVAEIKGLKPNERELINLRVWEDMTFEEIAEILEEKAITVRQRFYRAVEKVRVSLSQKNYKRFASVAAVLGCFSSVQNASAFTADPTIASSIAQNLNILTNTTMNTGILTNAKVFITRHVITTTVLATSTVAILAGGGYVAYNKINEGNIAQVSQNDTSNTVTPIIMTTTTATKSTYRHLKTGLTFDYIDGMDIRVTREDTFGEPDKFFGGIIEVNYNGNVLELTLLTDLACTEEPKYLNLSVDKIISSESATSKYIARTVSPNNNNEIMYGNYSSAINSQGYFSECDNRNLIALIKNGGVNAWITKLVLKEQKDLESFDQLMASIRHTDSI